ncbi:hypothetical protein LX77_01913 [Gelidibacter algens]|uniref:Uncharacterized protein n=1 Tax=Gelidibacter algens TaxID=49280 RepID=A0A327S605_9FLAO|nr:hypothetical protein [Gelidibacter algens]RAJ24361.1 hypothetical protein LX77_01913 [Gelidibacter algens]
MKFKEESARESSKLEGTIRKLANGSKLNRMGSKHAVEFEEANQKI